MADLQRLKERIGVVTALTRFGADFPDAGFGDEEVKFFCPFCEDAVSTRPAGTANDMKGVWHCWSCGRGGDVFSAAQAYLEDQGQPHSFKDALTWLLVEWPDEDVLPDPWGARDAE